MHVLHQGSSSLGPKRSSLHTATDHDDVPAISMLIIPRCGGQGREDVAEALIAVLQKVPNDHLAMTVSLLNEKWDSPGDAEAEGPPSRELQ